MATRTLILVLGDQLSHNLTSLTAGDPEQDRVLMCEVAEEATYVPHHQKKIAFLFSAMRHFAEELRNDGISVQYVKLDDTGNAGSLKAQVADVLEAGDSTFDRIIVTKPGEWRLLEDMQDWSGTFGVEVELRDDDRFIATLDEFADWADGRKQLRMEYFYR
ncbi:MAG: cryptochrome/photolyase family protein, partial [Pseudomonadota bacterium]